MSEWDIPSSGGSPDGGSSTLMMGGSSLMCVCSLIACILGFVLWWIYDKASFCKVFPMCGSETNAPNTNTIPNTGTDTTLPANNPPAPPAGGTGDWKCIQSSSDGGNWVKTKNASGKVLCAGPDANSCFWSPTEAECQGKPSNDGLVCTQTAAGWCKDAASATSSGGGAPAPPSGGGGGGVCNKKPVLRNKAGNIHLNSNMIMGTGCDESIYMWAPEIKMDKGAASPCLSHDLTWVGTCGTNDPKIQWEATDNKNEGANGNWYLIKTKGANPEWCLAAQGAGNKVYLDKCDKNKDSQMWWQINKTDG